jgi:hypothetical protein
MAVGERVGEQLGASDHVDPVRCRVLALLDPGHIWQAADQVWLGSGTLVGADADEHPGIEVVVASSELGLVVENYSCVPPQRRAAEAVATEHGRLSTIIVGVVDRDARTPRSSRTSNG